MNPVFTLTDLNSVGSIDPYALMHLGAGTLQEDIPAPPDGAQPDLQKALAVLSDPGKRLAHEVLARGYAGLTKFSVLIAPLSPWRRLMRGVALLRDAEDAEDRDDRQESLRAWIGAEHDLSRVKDRRAWARALGTILRSWGIDREQATEVAMRVGRAIVEELLPLAHLRAFLRRPPSNGDVDDLHRLHLAWIRRVPSPTTEEFTLATATAIHLQLEHRGFVDTVMPPFLELVTANQLDPASAHLLVSHMARRLHAKMRAVYDRQDDDRAKVLWDVAELLPSSLELARCVAAVRACIAINADDDHDEDQLDHAWWSLVLDPHGPHAECLRELVDTIIAVDPYADQPMSTYCRAFMSSETGKRLASYRAAALVEQTCQRLGVANESQRTAVARLLTTLDVLATSDEPPADLPQAMRDRLGPTCGLTSEQWDVLAPYIGTLVPGDGSDQLASVLLQSEHSLQIPHPRISACPTGSALAHGGMTGPSLRRLSYAVSRREAGAKLMAIAGVAMILHGSFVGISRSIRERRLDTAYERATEAAQHDDHDTTLQAALEFLETDDEPDEADPRHERMTALAIASAQSCVDALSDSSDGDASLRLLEKVIPAVDAPEALPELRRQVDQVVLDQASALALSGQNAEVEQLLARRAELAATLDAR